MFHALSLTTFLHFKVFAIEAKGSGNDEVRKCTAEDAKFLSITNLDTDKTKNLTY